VLSQRKTLFTRQDWRQVYIAISADEVELKQTLTRLKIEDKEFGKIMQIS